MGILTGEQLKRMGFLSLGVDLKISDRASFYGAPRISLGDHTRIDDFCVISSGLGGISIGRHVHIAVYSSLIGAGRIEIGDFSNISSRVSLYSSSDDYSGSSMTNPTVPDEFKKVHNEAVTLGRHVIVGCGSVILPGARLEDGVAIGAMSLVRSNCAAWGIYAGIPTKRMRERSRELLELERHFERTPPSQ
jgi:galactoside O-acetyltransferase